MVRQEHTFGCFTWLPIRQRDGGTEVSGYQPEHVNQKVDLIQTTRSMYLLDVQRYQVLAAATTITIISALCHHS
jgi:hypothetical protein